MTKQTQQSKKVAETMLIEEHAVKDARSMYYRTAVPQKLTVFATNAQHARVCMALGQLLLDVNQREIYRQAYNSTLEDLEVSNIVIDIDDSNYFEKKRTINT